MGKKIIIGVLLMATMLLCACGTDTVPDIEINSATDTTSVENEPPAGSNATGSGNSAVPNDNAKEQMEIFELVQGKWLCETETAFIDIYLPEDAKTEWDYDITITCDYEVHPYGYYVNDFAHFEWGVPHYAYPPEDGILTTETAVYFHSRDGEFDMGGLLVVDNERQYMKFELETGTWYTFYPYEQDTSIYLYSLSKTLATDIKTGTGIKTLNEDALRETVLLLNDYGVSHFFYFDVTPMGDTYMIKTHCSSINYEYPEQERDIIFYIDSEGNPIRESEWKDGPHQ